MDKYESNGSRAGVCDVVDWREIVGDAVITDDLPDEVREHPGLISLTTIDGVQLSPVGQFDMSDCGAPEGINPALGALWAHLKEAIIDEGTRSEWTVAGSLLYPLRDQDDSVIDMIRAVDDLEELQRIISLALDANGVPVTDETLSHVEREMMVNIEAGLDSTV